MSNYVPRLSIPVTGDQQTEFFDVNGVLIAKGYSRIVIGDRGPYVQFNSDHLINDEAYFVPDDQEWRFNNSSAYYWEFRTKGSNIKVYAQQRLVDYADYKIGFFYMSPFELYDSANKVLISKLK